MNSYETLALPKELQQTVTVTDVETDVDAETNSAPSAAPAPSLAADVADIAPVDTDIEIANAFETFDLPANLKQTIIKDLGFKNPTPIQKQAIPVALAGRDVLASAQTGTGKTAAFCIPMIAKLMQSPRGSLLILTPTRELAVQVVAVVNALIRNDRTIKTALLIGGEPMPRQLQQLRQRPRIVVGTPGRVIDHLERGTYKAHDADLILDETDRMLDMGFGIQLDQILKFVPKDRQTLMFSATLPPAIVKLADKYLSNPERIAVGSTTVTATNIKQEALHIPQAKKLDELLRILDTNSGSVIIFVKTKHGADKLADKLYQLRFSAKAIHGDLRQSSRDKVIRGFRDKSYRILVATDVAARGLDIPHIEVVINYDLPQSSEDYIHRVGRTARAGSDGIAISFVSPDDSRKWRDIQIMLNPGEKPPAAANRNQRGNSGGGSRGNSSRSSFAPRRDRDRDSYQGRKSFGDDRTDSNREPRREFDSERRPSTGDDRRDSNRGPRKEFDSERRSNFGGERRDSNRGPRKEFDSERRPSFGDDRRDSNRGPRKEFDPERRTNHAGDDRRDSNRGGPRKEFDSERRNSNFNGERRDSNRGPRKEFDPERRNHNASDDRRDSNRGGPRKEFDSERRNSNFGGERRDSNRGPRREFDTERRNDSGEYAGGPRDANAAPQKPKTFWGFGSKKPNGASKKPDGAHKKPFKFKQHSRNDNPKRIMND
ncbi:MAG: DEAD/DEAH box helicase [Alphaproteobacteria bacterium]|nr:DEAD/DEAH box helicase [Alphaproteobacteria bacterium]